MPKLKPADFALLDGVELPKLKPTVSAAVVVVGFKSRVLGKLKLSDFGVPDSGSGFGPTVNTNVGLLASDVVVDDVGGFVPRLEKLKFVNGFGILSVREKSEVC